MRVCQAPLCEKSARARFCSTHYYRLRKHGSLDLPVRPEPVVEVAPPSWPHIPLVSGGGRWAAGFVRSYARVDQEDLEWLGSYRWHQQSGSRRGYAARMDGRLTILMHREILDLARGNPLQGDHINRNRIDNRRSNLRIVDLHEQAQNMSAHRDSVSGVRGVIPAWGGRWFAYVHYRGQVLNLGYYDTVEEAGEVARQRRLELMPKAVD